MAVSDKIIYLIWPFLLQPSYAHFYRAGDDPPDKKASRIYCRTRYCGGRLSENSNGAKFSPTGGGKIEANSQCNSHFMAENSNKNGIESHRSLVFGQSGGG